MIMALTTENKLGFVDGSLPRPSATDLLFDVWNHCNNMVTSWILNVVSRDTVRVFCISIMRLMCGVIYTIASTKAMGSMDVNKYYTKLKILWDELKKFQPIPVFALIVQEECQLSIGYGISSSLSPILIHPLLWLIRVSLPNLGVIVLSALTVVSKGIPWTNAISSMDIRRIAAANRLPELHHRQDFTDQNRRCKRVFQHLRLRFEPQNAFMCKLSSNVESASFSEVVLVPEWKKAIYVELEALETNGT
uniref:Uncharacterized protein n=1 Tax=Vitis vinifera TaxID=29760 RepID=A5AXU0_VITVI|nr:hypothetical protein VITISV_004742 [Vitis vinifera]